MDSDYHQWYVDNEVDVHATDLIEGTKKYAELNGEDAYWLAKCLIKCTKIAIDEEFVVRLIRHAFSHGLTYAINREEYLDGALQITKSYFKQGEYSDAINYLMWLVEHLSEVPDWIHIYYLTAQTLTDNIYRIIDDPFFFYQRLDKISSASSEKRGELYLLFLTRVKQIQMEKAEYGMKYIEYSAKKEQYCTSIPDLEHCFESDEYTELDELYVSLCFNVD